jgi:hypothetical protein
LFWRFVAVFFWGAIFGWSVFGWQDTPGHFEGLIEDVSVWKKALNDQEVCSLAGKTWSGSSCS